MKIFANKEISKKIIIALILVMSFNFISPTVLHAQDAGGALFKPIGQLLCAIGDAVIMFLQKVFLGNGQIDYTVADGITTYNIQYSPGVIFSNKVPGLDINFIDPQEDYQVKKPSQWQEIEIENGENKLGRPTKGDKKLEEYYIDEILKSDNVKKYGFSKEVASNMSYIKDEGDIIGLWYEDETEYKRYTWEHNGKEYLLVLTVTTSEFFTTVQNVIRIFFW